MDALTCPHCGRRSDRPVFLPRAQQQIFDFIWNNPGYTREDIEKALYNGMQSHTLLYVQISKIRANLTWTKFRLIGGATTGYKIEELVDANL